MADNRPPIFTDRSLNITTKVIAIYALFFTVTALVPILYNPVSENELMPQNHYAPVYFSAGIHLLVLLSALFSILKKSYSWILAGICLLIIFISRFYYQDIAVWVWEWSS